MGNDNKQTQTGGTQVRIWIVPSIHLQLLLHWKIILKDHNGIQ